MGGCELFLIVYLFFPPQRAGKGLYAKAVKRSVKYYFYTVECYIYFNINLILQPVALKTFTLLT